MNTVLFDLDGTLLPMDVEAFTRLYFHLMSEKMMRDGFDAKTVMKGVGAGYEAMIKNDGTCSNEEVFWQVFEKITEIKRSEIEAHFYEFYTNDFKQAGGEERNENMIAAVQLLYQKGYRLFLTTNPLFPAVAVEERLRWAGIQADLFEHITTYETSHACKPDLNYYEEVLEQFKLEPENCMMVGNDTEEDGVIEQLNIPLYLVEDYIINRSHEPLTSKWHGTSEQFLSFVKALPEIA